MRRALTFEPPDPQRFPALRIAREALADGGTAPTVLNAANEVAVAAFLDRRIGFLDIARTVERTLDALPARGVASIEDVVATDLEARDVAGGFLGKAQPALAVAT